MSRYLRLGLVVIAGAAAGIAVLAFLRKREVLPEHKQSYAEAAEASEI